jgi:PTS system glucitol/sorbitol-specific IIC component
VGGKKVNVVILGITAALKKAAWSAAKKIFRRETFFGFVQHVLPVLVLAGIIAAGIIRTGLGTVIGEGVNPIPDLLVVGIICFIPAISPIIGPGLGIVLMVTFMAGEQIAAGSVNPFIALPALLAIDAQVGGSFVPSSMALGEGERETINVGVPPILFSRLITVPAAVVIAYLFCFGFK